ncbi:DUF4868 domain-containing protein [Pseudomonas kielensis]|uniref:DUF4868 domain-containing protein n=1 Tax=Pseudomonas kielensis TaxID=2762577 RepID=UPI0022409FB7|nr:DUF4868 domain-containing protein [Pseudomonas kielensis]UZM12446.1 DUF4868 domain-containing protein [Pseudomonas kielensis]
MQLHFDSFRGFNYVDATVHLWIFKRSTTDRKFNTAYVQTDDDVNTLLKNVAIHEVNRTTEFAPYSYLAQTNENSCLATPVLATNFSLLKVQVDRPEPECAVESVEELKGAQGYVVKFTHNGHTIYAVKRSTASWKTSYPNKFINMVFSNGELSAAENNSFSIEKNFDFYCSADTLLISAKRAFESLMQYKEAYTQAFQALQANAEFSNLFSDLAPLAEYIGTNSTQLRRMATIEQKSLYSNPGFMVSLQDVNALRGWGVNFDQANGKIIVCRATAPTILQVLLDHRLMSEVTSNIYDVPDAIQI